MSDAEFMYEAVMKYDERVVNVPPVIVLGDLWSNNILFHKNSDQLAALIDFQV